MMMTTTVFEDSLARDIHTHTHGQTSASSILNFLKVVSDFENKKRYTRDIVYIITVFVVPKKH